MPETEGASGTGHPTFPRDLDRFLALTIFVPTSDDRVNGRNVLSTLSRESTKSLIMCSSIDGSKNAQNAGPIFSIAQSTLGIHLPVAIPLIIH